jgi:inner membrane protein
LPSFISHAVAATGIAAPFYREGVPARLLVVGAAFAAMPDLDAIGFWFGVPSAGLFGHRGITHSLCFALVLASSTVLLRYRQGAGPLGPGLVWLFLALATASHGLLDTLTDGGRGVALLAPFSDERFFAPFRPIAVSPIGFHGVLSLRGLRIAASEVLVIGLPSVALWIRVWCLRRDRSIPHRV